MAYRRNTKGMSSRSTNIRQKEFEQFELKRYIDIVLTEQSSANVVPKAYYAVFYDDDGNEAVVKKLSSHEVIPYDFIDYFYEGGDKLFGIFGDYQEGEYVFEIYDKTEQPLSSEAKLEDLDIVYIHIIPRQDRDEPEILTEGTRQRRADSPKVNQNKDHNNPRPPKRDSPEPKPSSSVYSDQPPEYIRYDREGKMHGPVILYDRDGKLEQIGNYSHGVKTGAWTMYDADGSINSSGVFEDGNKTGGWVIYHKNGKVNAFGPMMNGEKLGIWNVYNEDGTFKKTVRF